MTDGYMTELHKDVAMTGGELEVDQVVAMAKSWTLEQMELFRKLLQNVVDNPQETKYRKLKLSNARIASLFTGAGAHQCFSALGWISSDAGAALELPSAADLSKSGAVLQATLPPPPGETLKITVLRGTTKNILEVDSNASLAVLAASIEQSAALGRIPRSRQRLLVGYPPKLLEESQPNCASMTIGELKLKAIKLEDFWEEMVVNLRSCRATFTELTQVLSCKKTLQDNFDFLLSSARALLKAHAGTMTFDELKAARKCFAVLWPQGVVETTEARVAFCVECTAFSSSDDSMAVDGEESSGQFVLDVDRSDIFNSALLQVGQTKVADLKRPLEVRFQGEAAEDSGGPRREFFNEFARAASTTGSVWRTTPAGSLVPLSTPVTVSSEPNVFQLCGRILGLALRQTENAAQEQQVNANATLADMLAAVRAPEEDQPKKHQKLLFGVPLAKTFIRVMQGDAPETLKDLQDALNSEQSESSPDFRGSPAFLESSLQDLQLEGQLNFSVSKSDGSVIDLVPNGRQIIVTNANKAEWLRATLQHELVDSISQAADAFRTGVCEVAGASCIVLLSAAELCEEWSGRGTVDDQDLRLWQEQTKVNPTRKKQAAWFFEFLWEEQCRSARPRVLKFTTGSDRWPTDSKSFSFSIEPMDGGDDALPRAMTCGNMLQLPMYTCKDALCRQLLKACEWGISMSLI